MGGRTPLGTSLRIRRCRPLSTGLIFRVSCAANGASRRYRRSATNLALVVSLPTALLLTYDCRGDAKAHRGLRASTYICIRIQPGSRFILRKFIRKFFGLTSVVTASSKTPVEGAASPAVDAMGQLLPPSPSGCEAKKNSERSKSVERRKKFGQSWSSSSGGRGGWGATRERYMRKVSQLVRHHPAWRRALGWDGGGRVPSSSRAQMIVMLENQGADNLPRSANSEFLSLLLVFFSYQISVP